MLWTAVSLPVGVDAGGVAEMKTVTALFWGSWDHILGVHIDDSLHTSDDFGMAFEWRGLGGENERVDFV
jgi:hypothetical protein